MAGVTGQQGMYIPPRYLTAHVIRLGVRDCTSLNHIFYIFDDWSLFVIISCLLLYCPFVARADATQNIYSRKLCFDGNCNDYIVVINMCKSC